MASDERGFATERNGYASGPGPRDRPMGPEPDVLVDLVAATFGNAHRPVHTLGIGLVGTFTPALGAATFCRAKVFQGPPTPVTARFSDGVGSMAGNESTPDVRGLAVRFHAGAVSDANASGDLDLVSMTLPCFFAKTPDDFAQFCRVSVPATATGLASKSAFTEWLMTHPTSATAVDLLGTLGIDVTFGGVSYYGIHAFEYVGPCGTTTTARFSWVPDTPVPPLPRATKLPADPPDRLRREMTARARSGGSPGFSLVMQVQGPGDPADDPTVLWTSTDRRTIGHLQLGGLVADQYWDCEAVRFNPTRLIDGISPSSDPILAARGAAYEVSATRRCEAYPAPSRVPTAYGAP